MSKPIKKIGVLTSGGDAPGMNAAIRSVVRAGIAQGLKVMGIKRGYNGLINADVFEMNVRSVSDIIQLGGTKLLTARCLEFKEKAGVLKAKETCEKFGIDGIVVLGGDGSFRGARDLSLEGIPCIGVPCTIDNDISSSEYTIGFDTATNTTMQLVDKLRDTIESHDRCSVVEVMGRDAGYIALHAGIACGATKILVKEIPFDLEKDVIQRMLECQKTGKQHFIIIVSEGVGGVQEMGKAIQEKTGIETKVTVLGHVQRGGSPTARDRVVASEMGHKAVQLLGQGIGNRVVVVRENQIVDLDIYEALAMQKNISMEMCKIAQDISI